MGGERGVESGQGTFAGEGGVIGDTGRVYHAVDVKTTRFRGFWGKQGGWDVFRGGSESSSSSFRCSRAVVRGLEWGRAGNSAGIDVRVDVDVAVVSSGSRCGTGDGEASWGGVGGGMSRHWCSWDGQSSFIECTTRSDERIRTTSHNAVFRAVDWRRTSFGAWWVFSDVVAVIWVLDSA
jgi:hypothetical protein